MKQDSCSSTCPGCLGKRRFRCDTVHIAHWSVSQGQHFADWILSSSSDVNFGPRRWTDRSNAPSWVSFYLKEKSQSPKRFIFNYERVMCDVNNANRYINVTLAELWERYSVYCENLMAGLSMMIGEENAYSIVQLITRITHVIKVVVVGA